MKRTFAGAAFCAAMIGLTVTGQAKADAIGFASLDFSAAFFSAPGSSTPADLSHVTFNSVSDVLTNAASLDASSGSDSANRTGLGQNSVDPALVSYGSYSGGQNNFGFTAANTTFSRSDSLLTGNLRDGNINANVVAETQVQNGHAGTANTSSTSASNDNFTANSNLTLVLNVAGTVATYTKLYNATGTSQSAHASTQFEVKLVDTSSSTTVLDFAPTALNTSLTASATPEQSGSSTPTAFALTSSVFTLIAHDHYTLTISQTVSSDATAPATANNPTAGDPTTTVPEPGTIALLGAGLACLGFLSFRRRQTEGAGA
ncbi:hypothetical protein GCM10011611_20260 [Aliidongia dinghuensis]|uniref:Ice-binding protein C-terminal domain-containing protein n=1 Tax=Aliidongia dinghuensis TaxID=1867774 RepID=A0A8J3E4H1_9PROT|nr:EDSAP-1 family PEP-CTERM protein [Aliidongia dinghuensis]GGF14413.1 hypothetical protein GCM10011611_20260 [Aliidongia dinghuensis]